MNRNMKGLITAVILAVVAVLLQIAGYYFLMAAILNPFLMVIIFVIIYLKSNLKCALLTALAAAIAVFFVSGNVMYVSFQTLVVFLAGVTAGYAVKKKKSNLYIFISISTGFFLFFVMKFVFTNFIFGINDMKVYFEQTIPLMLEEFLNAAVLPEVVISSEELSATFAVFYYLLPAMLIVMCAVMGYITLMLCSAALKKIKSLNAFSFNVNFSLIKADTVSVVIYLFCLIALLSLKNSAVLVVVMNVYFILFMFLSISGVSVIDYWLKHKYSIVTFVRFLLIFAVFILLAATQLLTLLAVIDARRDLRKLDAKGGKDEK